jgi:hypothetical protein
MPEALAALERLGVEFSGVGRSFSGIPSLGLRGAAGFPTSAAGRSATGAAALWRRAERRRAVAESAEGLARGKATTERSSRTWSRRRFPQGGARLVGSPAGGATARLASPPPRAEPAAAGSVVFNAGTWPTGAAQARTMGSRSLAGDAQPDGSWRAAFRPALAARLASARSAAPGRRTVRAARAPPRPRTGALVGDAPIPRRGAGEGWRSPSRGSGAPPALAADLGLRQASRLRGQADHRHC